MAVEAARPIRKRLELSPNPSCNRTGAVAWITMSSITKNTMGLGSNALAVACVSLSLCFFLGTPTSIPDVDYRCIRCVEWLVDNSDTIVVARYKNREDDSPQVVHTFKGEGAHLQFPLAFHKTGSIEVMNPSSNGLRRILFIRGKSKLLAEVDIARVSTNQPVGWAYKMVYGVTQFGAAILTEGELFAAIEKRVENPPECRELGNLRTAFRHEAELAGAFVGGPPGFFLNHDDWYFMLEVPYNEERRDHFVDIALESIHPLDVMWAIDELRYFNDGGKSLETIEKIANDKSRVLTPAFRWDSAEPTTLLDVRKYAWRALHGPDAKLKE